MVAEGRYFVNRSCEVSETELPAIVPRPTYCTAGLNLSHFQGAWRFSHIFPQMAKPVCLPPRTTSIERAETVYPAKGRLVLLGLLRKETLSNQVVGSPPQGLSKGCWMGSCLRYLEGLHLAGSQKAWPCGPSRPCRFHGALIYGAPAVCFPPGRWRC